MSKFVPEFMREAIRLSMKNARSGAGGPFGAVVVKDGEIVASSANRVVLNNDPTAHAEIEAIRAAGKVLNTHDLSGCEIYSSCEPCPMCVAAIYWARISHVYYGNTRNDAADINFDDDYIYHEIERPIENRELPMSQHLETEAIEAFRLWNDLPNKIGY